MAQTREGGRGSARKIRRPLPSARRAYDRAGSGPDGETGASGCRHCSSAVRRSRRTTSPPGRPRRRPRTTAARTQCRSPDEPADTKQDHGRRQQQGNERQRFPEGEGQHDRSAPGLMHSDEGDGCLSDFVKTHWPHGTANTSTGDALPIWSLRSLTFFVAILRLPSASQCLVLAAPCLQPDTAASAALNVALGRITASVLRTSGR